MKQEPELVARFVGECVHSQWLNEDDPVNYGGVHDTVSSDYGRALDFVGWTHIQEFLWMLLQLGLGMIADQIVDEVKTVVDNGVVTDLQLPVMKWDTVDAAWGTVCEKDWEAVANTPPRQCVDGITFATYKHWRAASPVVIEEITGWEVNDPNCYRPGMPEYVACPHLVQPAHLVNFMRFRCADLIT